MTGRPVSPGPPGHLRAGKGGGVKRPHSEKRKGPPLGAGPFIKSAIPTLAPKDYHGSRGLCY